jgi:glycosyltransferase involved in cell wall biosynthesis
VAFNSAFRLRIAVNTRLLLKDKLEGIGRFTFEVLRHLAEDHPEHEFIFLFDRPFSPEFIFASNITPVVLFPPARHPILFVIWFEWSVARWLKKHRPDLFLSPDGYLSLGTKVKSLPVIHDLNFEHYPQSLPFLVRKYYRWFFPRFAAKATRIATVSSFSRQDIQERYNIPADRIDLVYNGVNEGFHPAAPADTDGFRQQYTEGHPYFLAVGSIQPRKNVVRIIRAFDALRKAHPASTARLVLVGEKYWWDGPMGEVMQSVEFAGDIVFTGRLRDNDLNTAYSGALALVYVSYFEGFGIPLLEAMRCHTPVIAANATSLPEVAGDAALYVDPFSEEEITRAMVQVLTDTGLCDSLIAAGKIQCERFSWKSSSQQLWESIEKTILQNVAVVPGKRKKGGRL